MLNLGPDWRISLALVLSVLASLYLFPIIHRVSVRKNFTGMYGFREHYKQNIPNMTGIGMLAVILTISLLFIRISSFPASQYGIVGLLVVMMIGVESDVFEYSRWKTLIKWLIVVFLVVYFSRKHLPSLVSILSLPDWTVLNYIAIYILFVLFIYTFQYIDRIEGNTSLLSMICSLFFGSLAYDTDHFELAILCASVFGTMMIFHYFELHSIRFPLLMGKGGSWLLGFLLALVAMLLLAPDNLGNKEPFSNTIIAFFIGLLFFPLSERLLISWFRFRGLKNLRYHILFRKIRTILPERPAASYLYFCFYLSLIMISLLLSLFTSNYALLSGEVLLVSLIIQLYAFPILKRIQKI